MWCQWDCQIVVMTYNQTSFLLHVADRSFGCEMWKNVKIQCIFLCGLRLFLFLTVWLDNEKCQWCQLQVFRYKFAFQPLRGSDYLLLKTDGCGFLVPFS